MLTLNGDSYTWGELWTNVNYQPIMKYTAELRACILMYLFAVPGMLAWDWPPFTRLYTGGFCDYLKQLFPFVHHVSGWLLVSSHNTTDKTPMYEMPVSILLSAFCPEIQKAPCAKNNPKHFGTKQKWGRTNQYVLKTYHGEWISGIHGSPACGAIRYRCSLTVYCYSLRRCLAHGTAAHVLCCIKHKMRAHVEGW